MIIHCWVPITLNSALPDLQTEPFLAQSTHTCVCVPKPHPSNSNWDSLLLQIFRTTGQGCLHHSHHLTLIAGPKFHSCQSCQQLEPLQHTCMMNRVRLHSTGKGCDQNTGQAVAITHRVCLDTGTDHLWFIHGPSHPFFLSIPHLAAVQFPSPKHSLAHSVWPLKTLPQMSKIFAFLFSLFLFHSNWKGSWLD